MISSEDVSTFLAVVRSGSLLQAAEIVRTTQSTVSYRIQSLERQLGHALLLRSRGSRRVVLTTDGERFLDIAERWEMLQLEADQLKADKDRYLALGAVDALALHVLPKVFSALSSERPEVRLHVETGRYWQLSNRLASGHLAVVFTLTPADHADLVSVPIKQYPLKIAYIPGPTALPSQADMTAFDPAREIYLPWSTEIDMWRSRRGLSRLVTSVDKSHLLAAMLVNAGDWALIPDFMTDDLAARTHCRFHEIKRHPPPASEMFMIMRRSRAGLTSANQASLDAAMALLA